MIEAVTSTATGMHPLFLQVEIYKDPYVSKYLSLAESTESGEEEKRESPMKLHSSQVNQGTNFKPSLTRHYRTSYYDEEGDELCKGRSSNNSGLVEWIPEVRCWCGEIALGNGNCRYFQWLDSDVSDRVAKVIRGLLKRLDKQDSEMQRLQARTVKSSANVFQLN
nr:uncharacterized protein LOC109168447 [Ipomoea trifida]